MILFENSIVKLKYDPATDILEVAYPDLHTYLLPEIKHSIDIIVDILISYDIKKLLLDSSRTLVSVSKEESREVTSYLAKGISGTRIGKVARVQSLSGEVEQTAQDNMQNLSQTQVLPFQLQNFSNKAEALQWLKV